MKTAVISPFTPISKNIASHRSAEGFIYADQIKRAGIHVDVHMTGNQFDYSDYDRLYVYHGNEWAESVVGGLNLFGGMKDYSNIDGVIQYSKFKGQIYSLKINHPEYHSFLQRRISLLESKNKLEDVNPKWRNVDWDNFAKIYEKSLTIDPNLISPTDKLAIGDSHSICLYRPGWMVNSNPFKTLYGALKQNLSSFLYDFKLNKLEFYFGNIDIRHHLCRQPNPEEATRDLVRQYFDQIKQLNIRAGVREPLPIENESRVVPKTGMYKGTAFYGSWKERDEVRLIFKDECKKQCTENVYLIEWVDYLMNDKGELDFKCMEKPKSIHLSREYYPHWTGKEHHEKINCSTLEEFFND